MTRSTPDGMPYAEIPNDQVAGSARSFRETADFLNTHREELNCVAPLLMVAAFGIELFLKSLNSKCEYRLDDVSVPEDGYWVTAEPLKRDHSLVLLLDAIDTQFRKGLDEAYSANPVIGGKTTLKDALSVYDKLFVGIRYHFDGKLDLRGVSISGLIELLDLIADHVGSLPKVWVLES